MSGNSNYVQGAVGSISGFDTITLTDDTIVNEANFSIQQLKSLFESFSGQYAPERIRMLEKTILSHIRNFDNPHQDTIGQLSPDLVASLLTGYAPGTVPLNQPIMAVQAVLEQLDMSLSSVTVTRDGEINVIDQQGFLAFVGANTVAVDWSHGYPVLPCWPAKQQLFANLDVSITDSSQTFVPLNTTAIQESQNGIIPVLMNEQTTFYETNAQTQFGFSHTLPNVIVGSEYTFSMFVYPKYLRGSLIYKTGNGGMVVYRISDGSVLSTPGLTPYLYRLPNGWWRIGIQLIADQTSLAGPNQILFCQAEFADLITAQASSLVYIGNSNTPIFVAYGPQLTTGPGVAPFTQTGAVYATTISSPGFAAATLTNTGMMAVRYTSAVSLIGGQNESLLTIPADLTVSLGNGILTSMINICTPLITQTMSYLNDTPSVYAISYSAAGVSCQATGNARMTVSSQNKNFGSLAAITDVVFGSFCGGIHAAEFYAVADDADALAFLVGEP